MSVEFVATEFNRPGRREKGTEPEKYTANILTDESISSESAEAFVNDVVEACGGDLEVAANAFRTGMNRTIRMSAAGLDPVQKAARQLEKLQSEIPALKGLSREQLVALIEGAKEE